MLLLYILCLYALCHNGVSYAPSCDIDTSKPVALVDAETIFDIKDQKFVEGSIGVPCDKKFGPSDIIFLAALERLLVVSDKGQIAVMQLNGSRASCFSPLRHELERSYDFEAVAYTSVTPDSLYVGIEDGATDGVALIQAAKLVIEQGEVVGITMDGQPSWEVEFPDGMDGNKGIEALAFVQNEESLEGGYFVIGDQKTGEARLGCSLPILTGNGCGDSNNRCKCVGPVIKPVGWKEVSSLNLVSFTSFSDGEDSTAEEHHDSGVILVGSDHDDRVSAYDARTGDTLNFDLVLPPFTGPGQEGIALVGCDLFISCDDGSKRQTVTRYTIDRCSCSIDSLTHKSLLSSPPTPGFTGGSSGSMSPFTSIITWVTLAVVFAIGATCCLWLQCVGWHNPYSTRYWQFGQRCDEIQMYDLECFVSDDSFADTPGGSEKPDSLMLPEDSL